MKNYMVYLFLICTFFSISNGHAFKTTVHNESEDTINVFFQAWFCFGIEPFPYLPRICKSQKNIHPHESADYQWKHIQLGKTVLIVTGESYVFQAKKTKEELTWLGFQQEGNSLISISEDFEWAWWYSGCDQPTKMICAGCVTF